MIPAAPSLNRVRTKKGAIESFFAELGALVDDAPTVTLGVVPAARREEYLGYASSWMTHYHPDVFCATILNAEPMGFYSPAQIA